MIKGWRFELELEIGIFICSQSCQSCKSCQRVFYHCAIANARLDGQKRKGVAACAKARDIHPFAALRACFPRDRLKPCRLFKSLRSLPCVGRCYVVIAALAATVFPRRIIRLVPRPLHLRTPAVVRRRLVHPWLLVDSIGPKARPSAAIERVPTRMQRVKHGMRVHFVAPFKMDDSRIREESRLEADEAEILVSDF